MSLLIPCYRIFLEERIDLTAGEQLHFLNGSGSFVRTRRSTLVFITPRFFKIRFILFCHLGSVSVFPLETDDEPAYFMVPSLQ